MPYTHAKRLEAGAKVVRIEFGDVDMVRDLNKVSRKSGSPSPFSDVEIVRGNGGWWIKDQSSNGFGYWYKTLWSIMRAWSVVIYKADFDSGKLLAAPYK